MKNKKIKTSTLGSKKKKAASDVSPSTGLPPLVEGQLRCFLRVTVSKILWTIQKPPAAPRVRLKWWGELSDGTCFRPRDSSQKEQKGVKTTARFAIRCGPKQFTSYLADMGMLVLDVVTKPDHLPIGRVQVSGISQLSPTHSISGFFTVVSPTSEKLGELQVSLALEPLSETYDSSSSIPTTDMSIDTAMAALSKGASRENQLVVPPQPLRLSINSTSGRDSVGSSASNTPRGKDHLYFQENTRVPKDTSSSARPEDAVESLRPASPHHRLVQFSQETETHVLPANSQASKDLISVLLDRGSKLRNAMVVSALQSDLDAEPALKDIHLPLPNDTVRKPVSVSSMPSSGKLLENLLDPDPNLKPTQVNLLPLSEYQDQEYTLDTENRAIQLLLGSVNSSPLQHWDGTGSPPESLSGGSSIYEESELSDPHYDQSLLENLFYKAPKSDTSLSDFSSEDDEIKSAKGKQKISRGHAGHHPDRPKQSLQAPDSKDECSFPEGATLTAGKEPSSSIDLSVDRLTLLGRIHLARVIIETLKIPPDSTQTTPSKKAGKGKPPRPVSTRKCTYFVEYHFPVASSREEAGQVSMKTEVVRVASSKIIGGVVKFQQRFVFPLHFSGVMIEQWWNMDLEFKIYARKSTQKKPVPIGTARFPLRKVIQSELLSLSTELSVFRLDGEKQELGPLKVSFELAADNKDFSTARSQCAGFSKAPSYAVTSPGHKTVSLPDNESSQQLGTDGANASVPVKAHSKARNKTPQTMKELQRENGIQLNPPYCSAVRNLNRQFSALRAEEEDGVLLHVLLMVPEGKDFTTAAMQPCNLYLNCKLFGTDEATRSPVIWGQNQPTFNFTQVAPVTLASRLLERMKNNVMVIEVWKKVPSPAQDKLVGLAKLPLHQFYMSFRDPKISHLLLQAQYPVVGVDSYMPVIDVFTGSIQGRLRVLLAMGSGEQILALQRLKSEEGTSAPSVQRPTHFLDQMPNITSEINRRHGNSMREHIFEIKVERVKGLTPLQSTVWGEADCFIQYSFPAQDTESERNLDSQALESTVSLRPFRTTTTLCVPDPVFNDSQSHTLVVPADVPVQRLLLNACSSQGLAGGGGIQFEVWCRYYYPNVRDQVVARGILPLSKLCAMVTMQRQEHAGTHTFSLPLIPRTDSAEGHHPHPSGLLDVCVLYKHSVQAAESSRQGVGASRVVTVAVQVHRASGLQAAARAAAERDRSFQYHADVGVNTTVSMQLSFLPESEKRMTRVVARTFCPEFDHHTEFSCNLVIQRSSGETCSLAELLQAAEATFTLYHRGAKQASTSRTSEDTVLGTVKVQLADLLNKRTGITGWFAVNMPAERDSEALQNAGGGLEISISFAHHSDRERVVSAAEALGWHAGVNGECTQERDEDGDGAEWQAGERALSISVAAPRLWLPLRCLLLAGRRDLERSTYCYVRFKLYDRDPFCSSLRHPSLEDEDVTTVTFKEIRTVELRSSQPLLWYLREERLEVQVWVAFGKEKRPRPHDTDRLVGSAYVDLSTLAKKTLHKLCISGVYPLFKRSAPDLSGAAVRVHITLSPAHLTPAQEQLSAPEESYLEDVSDTEIREAESFAHAKDSHHQNVEIQQQRKTSGDCEGQDSQVENTFAVSITVERAMHLSLKGSPLIERTGVSPSCCVSYATADAASPVTTAVIENTDCPVWDHQQQTRLSKEILVDPQQTLVFKVWHKGDVERVIGFASVDLSPLLSGFQSVCGWYNITDFSGQCQGQIKVSITPLGTVHGLREERLATSENKAKESDVSFQGFPLSYRTTAMYSSFPTHVTRYPEQIIKSTSPDFLVSERPSNLHEEHVDNVRRFHQSLQQGDRNLESAQSGEARSSRSALFTALRKNLGELDDIQRYFSQKLSTPSFPHVSDPNKLSRLSENGDYVQEPQSNSPNTEATQLLAKSSRLVCEVNNLFSGHHGKTQDLFLEKPQLVPEVSEDNVRLQDQVQFERDLTEATDVAYLDPVAGATNEEGISSPLCFPTENQSLSTRARNGQLIQDDVSSESDLAMDDATEQQDNTSDACSEDEYEEAVIQPRALNDVTGMTDRTSPWSSILSEPDMASVEQLDEVEPLGQERLEAQEVLRAEGSPLPDVLHDGHSSMPSGAQSQIRGECVWFDSHVSSRHTETALGGDEGEAPVQVDRDIAASSAITRLDFSLDSGNPSTADGLDNRPQDLHRESLCHERRLSSSSESFQCELSRNDSEEADEETTRVRLPDPEVLPNFFLPTQHLEASMRALRIAPVFPSSSSDTLESGTANGIPFRRVKRQKPSVPSPSTRKEETKRIAKIFAAQFSQKQPHVMLFMSLFCSCMAHYDTGDKQHFKERPYPGPET
ncbi:C2 domain-containing protein 3-like [Huso huso]|uniref:C2 domain-containing protein 3-like n=1 Tax=Huso huso TaxID=61971 RepID=A0ABR0ZNQ8_HUSHU